MVQVGLYDGVCQHFYEPIVVICAVERTLAIDVLRDAAGPYAREFCVHRETRI